jgi:hypothetical protein
LSRRFFRRDGKPRWRSVKITEGRDQLLISKPIVDETLTPHRLARRPVMREREHGAEAAGDRNSRTDVSMNDAFRISIHPLADAAQTGFRGWSRNQTAGLIRDSVDILSYS